MRCTPEQEEINIKLLKHTRELYNAQADQWSRDEPLLLSDYSARPFLLDLCEPVADATILDLGCGEGYVSRELMKRGAKRTLGIDISEKMIAAAFEQQQSHPWDGLSYSVADLRKYNIVGADRYDLVVAVFLFNYMALKETCQTMEQVFNALRPGGRLVFSVPHPVLPFLKKDRFPFYFETSDGYFSGRGARFPGQIWRTDRVAVNVQCVHKTVEDYFSCLRKAGFRLMPDIHELRITDEDVRHDPKFFGPLLDLPLHLAIRVEKQ